MHNLTPFEKPAGQFKHENSEEQPLQQLWQGNARQVDVGGMPSWVVWLGLGGDSWCRTIPQINWLKVVGRVATLDQINAEPCGRVKVNQFPGKNNISHIIKYHFCSGYVCMILHDGSGRLGRNDTWTCLKSGCCSSCNPDALGPTCADLIFCVFYIGSTNSSAQEPTPHCVWAKLQVFVSFQGYCLLAWDSCDSFGLHGCY